MEISPNTGGDRNFLEANSGEGSQDDADRNTKKVRFKDANKDVDTNMLVDPRDINRSIVNRIHAISFSNRIQRILFKEMEIIVVLKLLGRSIGHVALNNQINSLWKPTKPFHLMDIENGYFFSKFQCTKVFEKVLSQGLWLIYGQYLTVQPWTKDFNPLQPYPRMVMAWIQLLGLLSFLYKRRVLEEIGGTIGKVVKMDFNTDRRTKGRFAQMAVYVNLKNPLVSQVLVNGVLQRVEYESLPTIYFKCRKYGHTKNIYVF
ncbi:uncharacterized protein [Gossypium hirsutum]|uniref:DUF4283 domain-containing protein n=1 Tax=Gossypium hirsutum TaxID=3635 RepID=A0A1U8IAN6_GOSHI|nr:uncharacterized protein LOC107894522 [Gossypium hirsutum]